MPNSALQAAWSKLGASALLVTALLAAGTYAQAVDDRSRTVVNSPVGHQQLLGRHKFQLHWISWGEWKTFGDLTVTNQAGQLVIKGAYSDRKTGDYIEIDGIVTRVEDRTFDFQGKIVTRVSYINGGNPCTREGDMTFAITGKRRYWRLQQMQNPCDTATDYVDIFLR
ncbi:MAG: hypothetical protein SNJ67_11145 [Chloracidobacterium sp.]|uniref:DUF5666 domain-containing protein n=1 Tax=Chloracidobacterium validum TaxID=2821543 RepID=A0ABX8BBX3_9BACT|nr:hypothetical protein [Chloracidobacterium validum]QUW03035.1 hypothetical protein J8C06_00905 [Chloracidobacterium validum]